MRDGESRRPPLWAGIVLLPLLLAACTSDGVPEPVPSALPTAGGGDWVCPGLTREVAELVLGGEVVDRRLDGRMDWTVDDIYLCRAQSDDGSLTIDGTPVDLQEVGERLDARPSNSPDEEWVEVPGTGRGLLGEGSVVFVCDEPTPRTSQRPSLRISATGTPESRDLGDDLVALAQAYAPYLCTDLVLPG